MTENDYRTWPLKERNRLRSQARHRAFQIVARKNPDDYMKAYCAELKKSGMGCYVCEDE